MKSTTTQMTAHLIASNAIHENSTYSNIESIAPLYSTQQDTPRRSCAPATAATHSSPRALATRLGINDCGGDDARAAADVDNDFDAAIDAPADCCSCIRRRE